MQINKSLSDAAVINELGTRIKNLRLELNMTQAQLALRAGVSTKTVLRIEKGEDVRLDAFIKCLRVVGLLENLNLVIPEQQLRPIDYLSEAVPRKRASASGKHTDNYAKSLGGVHNIQSKSKPFTTAVSSDWKWGDEQ